MPGRYLFANAIQYATLAHTTLFAQQAHQNQGEGNKI
jgi:hypothetical protein